MRIPVGANIGDMRLNWGGSQQVNSNHLVKFHSDASWDYYDIAGRIVVSDGASLTLQHHGTEPHTVFYGDLDGRARAQFEWRELTGSSPHTVLTRDREFMVSVTHTDGSNVTYFPTIIPRILVSTVARRFGVVESNAEQANFNGQMYVNANLNAAGTELTTSIGFRGVSDTIDQNRYAIASVHAR